MKTIKIYYNKGFSIDAINEHGNTLLHMAARNRNYPIVKTLISDYDARLDIQNADGRNPLHIATMYGSTDTAHYIFHDKRIESISNIISLMINRSPHVLMMPDNNNMTPMNYYTVHSARDTNSTIRANYKSYRRKMQFFELIKKNNIRDYRIAIDIYFLLKGIA